MSLGDAFDQIDDLTERLLSNKPRPEPHELDTHPAYLAWTNPPLEPLVFKDPTTGEPNCIIPVVMN